jgi:hypothetical protein
MEGYNSGAILTIGSINVSGHASAGWVEGKSNCELIKTLVPRGYRMSVNRKK